MPVPVVVAVAGKVLAVAGYADMAGTGAEIADMVLGPPSEDVQNHGDNVISAGTGGVLDFMDGVADTVSSGRDAAGAAIHDAAASVPVLGGLLGASVDGAGLVVDALGGVWSEVEMGVRGVQTVSNVAGSRIGDGARAVENDSYKDLSALAEKDSADMSLGQAMREQGLVNGGFGWILGKAGQGVSGIMDFVTGGKGDDAAQAQATEVPESRTDEERVAILESAISSGEFDQGSVAELALMQSAGIIDGDDMASLIDAASSGAMTWDELAQLADEGAGLVTGSDEVAASVRRSAVAPQAASAGDDLSYG